MNEQIIIERVERILEISRIAPELTATQIMQILKIEVHIPKAVVEDEPVPVPVKTKQKRIVRDYTTHEQSIIRDILANNQYKPSYVPTHVLKRIASELDRTEGAITAQLYQMAKEHKNKGGE